MSKHKSRLLGVILRSNSADGVVGPSKRFLCRPALSAVNTLWGLLPPPSSLSIGIYIADTRLIELSK